MKDKFLLKLISIFVSAIMLCSCYGGDSYSPCYKKDSEVYILVETDVQKFPFANKTELLFLYHADSGLTLPHQFKLTNIGFNNETQTLTIDESYYCDFEADIYYKQSVFVSDMVKHTSLHINIKPARGVTDSYNSNRYRLDRDLAAEININNEQFVVEPYIFNNTNNYYIGDITFGGKNFSKVYKIKGSNGGDLYLSRDKIAHIKIGNRTWTNMAN